MLGLKYTTDKVVDRNKLYYVNTNQYNTQQVISIMRDIFKQHVDQQSIDFLLDLFSNKHTIVICGGQIDFWYSDDGWVDSRFDETIDLSYLVLYHNEFFGNN